MKIIQPSYEILTDLNCDEIMKHLERCGRTCYKSENKITGISAPKFVEKIVKRKHLAMIEFYDIQVRFIHNRGFTHEMVRHRLCSFAQESTRYCDYSGGLAVIEPWWYEEQKDSNIKEAWEDHMRHAENSYNYLRMRDLSPQAARGVLPLDVKTELVVKANLREWMHIFKLRCAEAAHPDMRRVMIPLKEELERILPEIFDEEKNK